MMMLGRSQASPRDLLNRLGELQDIIQNHGSNDYSPFILSTLHSSKGLEYDQVYLLDIFDGILPSKVNPNESSVEEVKEYEEARRLFYVGMTRAKKQLHVFRCHKIESAFIREVASSLPVEQIESDSIFASFLENLCGRSYTHKEKGKGQVIAQSGQLLLVENENTELDLRTIFELYDKRKVITLKEVKTQLKPEKKRASVHRGPGVLVPRTRKSCHHG